jgi:hypothetical protein
MSVTENKKGVPDSYKLNMKSQQIPVKRLLEHNIQYIMPCTMNLITNKLWMKSKLKDPAKKYVIIVVQKIDCSCKTLWLQQYPAWWIKQELTLF